MIELKVEEYCHDCPDFEADVLKHGDTKGYYDFSGELVVTPSYTIVYCAHANRCRAVKRYLEKKQKGE